MVFSKVLTLHCKHIFGSGDGKKTHMLEKHTRSASGEKELEKLLLLFTWESITMQ